MTDYDTIAIGSGAGNGVRIEILPQYMEALRAGTATRLKSTSTN